MGGLTLTRVFTNGLVTPTAAQGTLLLEYSKSVKVAPLVSWKRLMRFLAVIHAGEYISIYLLNINANKTSHSENLRVT